MPETSVENGFRRTKAKSVDLRCHNDPQSEERRSRLRNCSPMSSLQDRRLWSLIASRLDLCGEDEFV
ncbi:hypothetical protein OE88DRAFT_1662041 [Heliocybe sulcata]|uniref:Uncharacterized protein n=1 Tax=Heliocybe sulcata TaxID=5364 RepID=A0A5C3MX64_9AGAM|nr:hypothetical protein OE88DRAFT_1662041 [Heliocybe sulcata]